MTLFSLLATARTWMLTNVRALERPRTRRLTNIHVLERPHTRMLTNVMPPRTRPRTFERSEQDPTRSRAAELFKAQPSYKLPGVVAASVRLPFPHFFFFRSCIPRMMQCSDLP
jgi:hypothetical protein